MTMDSDHGEGRSAVPPNMLVPSVGRGEFVRFRDLLLQETGVLLTDVKRELLIARLSKRLRALGLRSFREYLDRVAADPDERVEMVDRLLTNETRFFREPNQFEFLEKKIAPQWIEAARNGGRARRVRVWSAGCSTGQEPSSIAMVLLSVLPGWDIEILGTDLSSQALRRAALGTWPVEKASEIPPEHLQKFMLRGVRTNAGTMRSNDQIRSVLRFRSLNLNGPLPEIGTFDAIFCRNVLIYFDPEARRRAIDRLLGRLGPGGYFFLGHSESLLHSNHRMTTAAPSVYVRSSQEGERV